MTETTEPGRRGAGGDGAARDTVFALSSAAGRAGVAVIRVSGPAAGAALRALTGRPPPAPRRATLARLRDPGSGETVDRGLVLWFPGPASFTGEDMAELHVHGGRATVAGVAEALAAVPGCRPAEPGEFTRRAFAAGKLDLTEVEGLADLIAAETAAQRRQALRQLEGELGALCEGWRQRLVAARAALEATIDFADEEDVTARGEGLDEGDILRLVEEITQHLDDAHRGERLREGYHVAILGPPNVGKSRLLNRLARREAAIVSETAGTTRDVIEVHLDIAGYPVIVADTAGLREAADGVEGEGIRRALARAEDADLKIAVFDAAAWPDLDAATLALVDEAAIPVLNKIDLRTPPPGAAVAGRPAIGVSAKTGEGIAALLDALAARAEAALSTGGGPALTRTRHRQALRDCVAALERALAAGSAELAAEDLRLAARALGRITGRVDVEDVLDVIFREFCIGK